MPIVSAGVHFAGVRRTMRDLIKLCHVQGVQIGPKRDLGSWSATFQRSDCTRLGETRRYIQAKAPKLFFYERGGSRFFKGCLGVGV